MPVLASQTFYCRQSILPLMLDLLCQHGMCTCLPGSPLPILSRAQVLRNVANDMGESGLYDSWSQAQPGSPHEVVTATEAEQPVLESHTSRSILESHASRVLAPIAEADGCADDLEPGSVSAAADLQVRVAAHARACGISTATQSPL